MTGKRKNPVDWEAVEREYRAGQLSVSEIGRQHDVSHTAINKRAKERGWARDLTKRVRAEVAARLAVLEVTDGDDERKRKRFIRDALAGEVSAAEPEVSSFNAEEAVETAAARGVQLVRMHRRALGRAAATAEKLQAELDRATDNIEEIEDAIEEETVGDKTAQRRNMMLKAVSLGGRASTALALSQTIKNLIPLERQAFNLQDGGGDDTPAVIEIVRFAD